MRRREFIAGLGGVAAWPVVAFGQEGSKIRRVGYLGAGDPNSNLFIRNAFLSGMRDLGYREGENFELIVRWWGNDPEKMGVLVEELVSAKVEVIVAPVSLAVRAAQAVTRTLPIVFTTVGDPVGSGFIASYAQPKSNATGMTMMLPELTVKRLELLKEALPGARNVAVLYNPTNPTWHVTLAATATDASAQWGRGWGPGWGWRGGCCWRGPGVGAGIAAGVVGGAIVAGAILATRPAGYVVYPGYAQPLSGPGCYWASQPILDPYGRVVGYTGRPVQVCPGYAASPPPPAAYAGPPPAPPPPPVTLPPK
jgi:hypothetical protein